MLFGYRSSIVGRAVFIAVFAWFLSGWAWSAQTGPHAISVRLSEPAKLPSSPGYFTAQATVSIGQQQFPMSFGLFLPSGYFSSREPFPVVMAIHNRGLEGLGGGGLNSEGMVYLWTQDSWDPRDPATQPQPTSLTLRKSAKFIGVAPQCPKEHPLEIAPMPEVLAELVTQLGNAYRVDQDRVYLTGFSWGGTHTWLIAEQTPWRYAAIVPISSKATIDPHQTAATLANMPVYLACGGSDVYFLQFCEQMNEAFAAAQHPDFVYRVLPGANHFCYAGVYTDPAFWDWLLAKRRRPQPATQPVSASTTNRS